MVENALIERWKSSLLTAPDEQFFQIMRIYLGDVKTPFNKHDLIRRLTTFLGKPETVDRILSLTDRKDARVLTAIALLEEPTMSRLYTLFESTVGYLALHYHVLNLEERMLIFRDESGDRPVIRIHPLLEQRISRDIIDPSLLFRFRKHDEIRRHTSYPADARLVAIVTHIISSTGILKNDGELRKRSAQELRERFTEDNDDGADGIRYVNRAVTGMGIIDQSSGDSRLNVGIWRRLCMLDPESRLGYLVAFAAGEEYSGNQSPGELAATACAVLRQLPYDRTIEEESLARLIHASSGSNIDEDTTDTLIGVLELLRLMERVSANELIRTRGTTGDDTAGGSQSNRPVLQATFELQIPITASAASIWFIPLVAELRNFDTISHYEITRSACARGFDSGIDGETMIDLLDDLCASPVPDNVRTSLLLWEQEFRGIRMIRGTVVVVDESRRHLFEYDSSIQELIHDTLAPGIYLIRTKNIEALRKHLVQMGIEPLPEITTIDSGVRSERLDIVLPPITSRAGIALDKANSVPEGDHSRESNLERKFTFEEYRNEISNFRGVEKLNPAELTELEERIGRRLVLFASQIPTIQPISEITEAKGFDYLGKVRLIEQAISRGNDLLEVTCVDDEGNPTRTMVKPDRLQTEGNELVLEGRVFSEETPIEFRVRTIGAVRIRRGSMLR